MNLIVWDIDDVLNDLMRAWFELHWRPRHPECSLHYSQLRENPPQRVLGISESEYLSSLDEFRLSGRARAMRTTSATLRASKPGVQTNTFGNCASTGPSCISELP